MRTNVWVGCEGPPATGSKHSRSGAAAVLVLTLLAIGFLFLSPGAGPGPGLHRRGRRRVLRRRLRPCPNRASCRAAPTAASDRRIRSPGRSWPALLTRILGLPPSANTPLHRPAQPSLVVRPRGGPLWAGLVSGDSRNRFLPGPAGKPPTGGDPDHFVAGPCGCSRSPTPGVTLSGPSDPAAPWLAAFRDRPTIAPEHARAVADAYRLGIMEGSTGALALPGPVTDPGTDGRSPVQGLLSAPHRRRADYPQEVPVEWYARQSSGQRGHARADARSSTDGPRLSLRPRGRRLRLSHKGCGHGFRKGGASPAGRYHRPGGVAAAVVGRDAVAPPRPARATGPRSTSSARCSS